MMNNKNDKNIENENGNKDENENGNIIDLNDEEIKNIFFQDKVPKILEPQSKIPINYLN